MNDIEQSGAVKFGSEMTQGDTSVDEKYDSVINAFTMTLKSIRYTLQVSTCLLQDGLFDGWLEASENVLPEFIKELPKENRPAGLREQAEALPLSGIAFWVIVCGERYFDLSKGKCVEEVENMDLYSAQMIFRIIRNSFAHPRIFPKNCRLKWNVEEPRYRRIYEVKKIGVILDATNLDGKPFGLAAIGGWPKFLALLRYLQEDLIEQAKRGRAK